MKVNVNKQFVDELRAMIAQTRSQMNTNRERRKEYIQEIRALKTNIKHGEHLCSKLEDGLVVDVAYLRGDLMKKRAVLNELRNGLLQAEVQYAVSKSVCRTVHAQLDRLNEPFDPQRARTANRKVVGK